MKRKELFRILVVLNLIVVVGPQSVYAHARSDIRVEAPAEVVEIDEIGVNGEIVINEEIKAVEEVKTVGELEVIEEIEAVEEIKTAEEVKAVGEVKAIEEIEAVGELEVAEETKLVEEIEVVEEVTVAEVTEVTEEQDSTKISEEEVAVSEDLGMIEEVKAVNDTEITEDQEPTEILMVGEDIEAAKEVEEIEETERTESTEAVMEFVEAEVIKEPEVVKEAEVIELAENKMSEEFKELVAIEEPIVVSVPPTVEKPIVEEGQPVEIRVAQDLVSANATAVKPQVTITGDFTNDQIDILIFDKDGKEVGRHHEKVGADGVTYDFAEINEDGIYIMQIQRVSADGQTSISKYVFTINQNGTSFCHDMTKENIQLEKTFSPRIKMENVDAITVLSCMINGEEVPYLLEDDELVIDAEILKSGKNQISLIVKDVAGNISEMKPWEFRVERMAERKINNLNAGKVISGNFWFRMIKKLLV